MALLHAARHLRFSTLYIADISMRAVRHGCARASDPLLDEVSIGNGNDLDEVDRLAYFVVRICAWVCR